MARILATDASDRRRLLYEGRDAFNRGAYFEAHELWEDVWRGLEGPERASVQALIQVAVALLKLEQGRLEVALRLFAKASANLEGRPDTIEGLNLARLLRDAESTLTAIESPQRPAVHLHLVSF